MKIDALILQLAIVFLPGIIWARLDAKYALSSKPSDTELIIRSFVFGIFSYAATFALYSLFGVDFTVLDFGGENISGVLNRKIAYEIVSAVIVGGVLSVLWIYAATYKWVPRFLQKVRATKRYGDEDVWDFTFNSNSAQVEYVHFRDLENKIVYAGWVNSFSETEKLRELVLRNVEVHNFDGEKLYEVPLMYLSRKPETIQVDFPYRGSEASNEEASDAFDPDAYYDG